MQAASPGSIAAPQAGACAPEQMLLVAALLCMSAGFLDAVTWLSLGRVFASSQTGNVVFCGMYAMSGQWRQAAHHLVPLAGFLLGAAVAVRIRAPLFCLVGEIVCLTVMMLLIHRIPDAVAILGISFGIALRSASFRQVEHKAYLSVAVTGNMLRGIDQLLAMGDVEALRGAVAMLAICLSFLLGAAIGGCLTMWLGAFSLVFPIASSACVLLLCLRHRRRSHRG